MTDTLLFIALPYAALAIFFIGSIYRYVNRGFKVSSLSSQFLEGRSLFWGSQPFHWGVIFLFFGHLIGLLFPASVIAWNGDPVRLIILELTAFMFALSMLFGLVMLVIRRITNPRVQVVTNYMDVAVYVILFYMVITGVLVAFFNRWGSSWFASVLTPYLKSVFVFNPDIAAVSAMPLTIKLHIIGAFLFVAIIPFTRFVHFLVYPLDYTWRSYQQVIWNWNRKHIRNSKEHVFGKRPRNH